MGKSTEQGRGPEQRPIKRSELRSATISALRRAKADPRSLRITAGQRKYITKAS